MLIASSREDELSYAGKPYSAFTLALIEALCGQGVAVKDGYVRAADLALHARQMVPGRTKDKQHPILHFEQADNFAVAYYAGGETQPKGLPFSGEPEIEPAPGAWRGGQQTTVYGDQITATGPVATHGSAINMGSGVAVAGQGNVVVTGKVGRDVTIHRQPPTAGGGREDFVALLARLRRQVEALPAGDLSSTDRADALSCLDQAAEQAGREKPPVNRILRALETVEEIIDAASRPGTAVAALAPVVARAIELARQII